MLKNIITSSRNLIGKFSLSWRLLCTATHSVKLTEDSRRVELVQREADDGDAKRAHYHGVWLRHNCRCPECYSASTNMMKLTFSKVYKCKEIESAHIKGSNLLVRWKNTDHEGVFPLDWLKENDYSTEETRGEKYKVQQPLIAKELPVHNFTDIMSSDEGTYRWLKDLNYYGVTLLKGIQVPETAVSMLATKFPHLLHYLGETHHITPKEGADDLGDSTNELPFHQDLVYYENPPGIFALNCIRNDPCVEGGENVVVDLYPIAEELRSKYPEYFEILTTTPITWQRIIMGREEEWDLRLTKRHIQLDRFGQVTGFTWSMAHPEPLCVHEDLVESYYDAMSTMERLINESKNKLLHKLSPGECLVLNNRRMVHSRKKFFPNGGVRHLHGFFVHTDYLRSQFLVFGKKLGKNELSTNVFMNNFL